jgi:hypothetical protein
MQITQVAERVQIYTLKHKEVPSGGNAMAELYGNTEPPKDGWGNDFIFIGGNHGEFDVISLGADGAEGGAGSNADIKWTEIKSH